MIRNNFVKEKIGNETSLHYMGIKLIKEVKTVKLIHIKNLLPNDPYK